MAEKAVNKDLPIRKSLMKVGIEFLIKRRSKMIRALIIPNEDLTQYSFTLQDKDANGFWKEITKVYRHPTDPDKVYETVEELKEDLADGKDSQE